MVPEADNTAAPDAHIGRAIARHRSTSGMSQVELAKAMRDQGWKWVQATVWNVEQGNRPVRLAEAASLSAIFGVSIESFLALPLDAAIHEATQAARVAAEAAKQHSQRASTLVEQAEALKRIKDVDRGSVISDEDFAWTVFLAFGFMDWVTIEAVGSQLGLDSDEILKLKSVFEKWKRDPEGPVYFPHVMAERLAAVLPTVGRSPE